jgi:protein-S-isoprenylcysteine O-methyltransferase Ste14
VQTRRERRFAFWGFLIVAALWICSLFYNRPTLSDWYDWLRLGGALFFSIMAILSYFIMRENWSLKEEERAYVVFTPIILVGAIIVSVVLHSAFG